MRFDTPRLFGLCSLVCLLPRCTPAPAESVGARKDRVVASELGRYFDYAFVPAPSLFTWRERMVNEPASLVEDRWRRELRELGAVNEATGSLLGAALDSAGDPLFLPERPEVPLRYSCGGTLVSPSYVVTAGHCVADDTGPVTLHMYRPTARLAETASVTTILAGSWPDFTHPTLTPDDGYLVDEYPCETVVRCDARWGATLSCPHGDAMYDVAVLRCDGRPGDTYGYVQTADEPAQAGSEVFVPWKHEVYDLAASTVSSTELSDHYVALGDLADNFHYQGAGRNQLLPLRSLPWEDGTPRTVAEEPGWTDMMGCHGTSGSGLFSLDATGYRLWGIATSGKGDLDASLCQNTDARLAAGQGPGSSFIGSNWFEPGVMWQQLQGDLTADCRGSYSAVRRVSGTIFDGASFAVTSWFSNLACQPLTASLSASAPGWPLEADAGAAFELGTEQLLDLNDVRVAAGRAYRVGAFVEPRDTCDGDCLSFEISLAQDPVAAPSLGGAPGSGNHVALSFVPAAAENGALEFRNLGQPALFSALTLIAEGQVNTFDTPFDRLETSLFTVTDTGTVGPAAMRFTGDGEGGFSALLFGGERLLLTRQALLGGRSWTARIEATSYTGLSCGFLASSGDVLLAVPCAAVFRLDASGIPQVPGAFFVEAERELASVEVSAVALASDLAPDDDGDGIADVLDDCPGVNDPSQNGCTGDAGAGMAPAQDAGVVPDQPRPDAGSGGELTDAGAPLEAGSTPPARFDAGPVGAGGGVSDIPPATGGSSGPSPEPTGSNRVEPSGPAPSSTPSPVQSPSPDAGVEGRTAGKDAGCGCRVGEPVGAPRFGWLWLALFTTLLFRRARVSHGRRGKRLARSCG